MSSISIFLSKHAGKLVVLIMFVFTAWYYSPVLFHPSEIILQDSGDAIKNYFSYEWHVQKDTSLINYTGSNYPYGEHHGYTDGNPLLSNFLKIFSFLKPYSIAIFDLSLILSFLLCAFLLFKIFKEFKVPILLSVIGSIGITILCPQVFRLGGHFALAYGFFLPLIIYLLLRFERTDRKVKYTIYILLSLTSFFFIHPYLGMISSSFVITYWIFKLVGEFRKIKNLFFLFSVQTILPVLIFFFFTKLTDTHTDRPEEPFGFLHFTASIETVFISTHPPFRHFLSQIYEIKGQNWEGIAYVGMTSLLAFLTIPYLLFRRGNRIKSHLSANPESKVLLRMLLAAIVLLMFSMGYPFKWGMEALLDHLPLVKQFRCPGRFAWVFYFVATIFSVVIISRYFLSGQRKQVRLIASSLLLFLFIFEGIPYHEIQTQGLFVKNCFSLEQTDTELKKIIEITNQEKTNALIPLPFFHIGTDYYDHSATDKIKRAANIVSFHTGVPMMANLTARVSMKEAESMITGVLGSGLMEKQLKKKVIDEETFIILYSKEELSEEESVVLSKAKHIYESENFILKEISAGELLADDRPGQLEFFKENRGKLIQEKGCFLSDSSFFEFDENVYSGNVNERRALKKINKNVKEGQNYELSFWYMTGKGCEINNTISIEETEKGSGRKAIVASRNVYSMPNIMDNFILGVLHFKIANPENEYNVYMQGHESAKGMFRVKNLMIKESGINVYQEKGADTLIVNNIPIDLKK